MNKTLASIRNACDARIGFPSLNTISSSSKSPFEVIAELGELKSKLHQNSVKHNYCVHYLNELTFIIILTTPIITDALISCIKSMYKIIFNKLHTLADMNKQFFAQLTTNNRVSRYAKQISKMKSLIPRLSTP